MVYFTERGSCNFKTSIIEYNRKSKIATKSTHESLDLQKWYTIQVGSNLFGFKTVVIPAEFIMWSGLGSNEVVTTHPKPTPPLPRSEPSLANFADNYIFVIAGSNPKTGVDKASVDIYTIGKDTWS